MCERFFESIRIEVESQQYHSPDEDVQHNIQQEEDYADCLESVKSKRDCHKLALIAPWNRWSSRLLVDRTLAMPPVAIVMVK